MIENELLTLYAAFALVVGIAIGYFLRLVISLGKKGSVELEVRQILLSAHEEAKDILSDAEKKADELRAKVLRDSEEVEKRRVAVEGRLIKKEELLDKRQLLLDTEANTLKAQAAKNDEHEQKLSRLEGEFRRRLLETANMTESEAEKKLFELIEKEREEDIVHRLHKLEIFGEERLRARAREILTTTIHRLGNAVAPEIMSTSVDIGTEDTKGKIIGKEGRNIRAFEKATGVELVIDDTPHTVLISSFDPVRREIARVALENLIKDGRIQPVRIEEMIEKAREEVNKIIKEKGEKAAYECGIYNLDGRVSSILGRLHFRVSYGQNVLAHSIEVAHIAGMLAEEIGADVLVSKTAGLLHDIGKAADHDIPGSHVEIGRRILQKFGIKEDVVKAMQAHHEEYPYETLESKIVQVADSISASRPGARRDAVDDYLKRLHELEEIATGFSGVEKAYALQAGREIRVFVTPETISDLEAAGLAKKIARTIEEELVYPGEVKVNVIRESRVVEYAR
jgi:ribonuclease Y